MKIDKTTLLHDIADLAYVIADVSEGRETPHTLHQTYDICEGENRDRVDNLLRLAAMEAAPVMSQVATLTLKKNAIVLTITSVAEHTVLPHTARKLMEELREYLTASVLAGWLSVTLPAAAGFWQQRKTELRADLTTTAAEAVRISRAFRRRLPPL